VRRVLFSGFLGAGFVLQMTVQMMAQTAGAVPGDFRLISPLKVKKETDSTLKVVYRIPCVNDSSSVVVLSGDNSADRLVAVGVAYSQEASACEPDGKVHKFTKLIDTAKRGWAGEFAFVPMGVETYNGKLTRYVKRRMDRGNPTIKEILESKISQLEDLEFKKNTLQCLGHRSWLTPSHVVGSCTVRFIGKEIGEDNEKDYNGIISITVSEDLNHPRHKRSVSLQEFTAFSN